MKRTSVLVERDFKFQKAEWPVLRVGWIAMGVFIVAGLAGFFGSGPLSEKSVQMGDVLIKYDKYLRYSMHSAIEIQAGNLSDSALYLNAIYPDKIKIDQIQPEPASMQIIDDELKVKFNSAGGRLIKIYVQPAAVGSHRLEIEINGRKEVLNQFIYF